MEFRVLGPLEVVDGDRIVAVGSGRRRSLLAYLLIHANHVVSPDRLIDDLWDEQPPATAAKSIQVHVSHLRKLMHDAAGGANGHLLTLGGGYMLRVAPGELDSEQFEGAVRQGRRLLGQGDADRAATILSDALTLWRGPPLADFAYERFAQSEIARLEGLRLAAVESRVEADLALGDHARLVGEIEALVAQHPLHERFRELLMLALYRCGRQAEALAVYRDASALLRDELGLDPSPDLRELERRIMEQDHELALPPAPRKHASGPRTPTMPAGHAARARRRGLAPIVAGAILLTLAAGAAIWQRLDRDTAPPRAALDLATNSVVAIDAETARPQFAVPLPGRPTDVTARDGSLWVATVDSNAVTAVNSRTRSITRSVPLAAEPDALAADDRGLWVADARHGELVRVERGYASVTRRLSYPRGPGGRALASERPNLPRAALATTAGAVWIANGSERLVRVDTASGAVGSVSVGMPVDDLAATRDAVWAMSAAGASVLRIDPASRRVTDTIGVAGRRADESASPAAIDAGGASVWVLNGNTATVTRIDPASAAVTATARIGVDRAPQGIAAARTSAWVAGGDGTLTRVDPDSGAARSIAIGESLGRITVDGEHIWVTTTAFDQKQPGGVR